MDGRPRAMHSAMSRWSNDTRVSCPEISQSLAAAAAFVFQGPTLAGGGPTLDGLPKWLSLSQTQSD